jgi:heat shock protein HslJ
MRAALLALALAACAVATPAADQPAVAAIHLAGTKWMRIDRSGDAPHFPTLDFAADSASGFAGCNRWNADAVQQDGERLAFSRIATTRMMCAESAMATEHDLVSVLERTRYAHYDRDALVLLDENSIQIARFERAD